MNTANIKTMVKLSGGKYEGCQIGTGVLVTNLRTQSTINIPLDCFFWENDISIISHIKMCLLYNTLSYKKAILCK